MSNTLRAAVGLLCLAILASATPAAAGTEGFFLGLDILGSRIGVDEPGDDEIAVIADEKGSGVHVQLGWGFTPTFAVRLNMGGVSHETTDPEVDLRLASVTVEAVYIFSPEAGTRPYLFGGLGGFAAESVDDALKWETDGPGTTFGGGIYFFLGESRRFAIDVGLRGEWINWTEQTATLALPGGDVVVRTPVEESGFAGKFMLGASYWF